MGALRLIKPLLAVLPLVVTLAALAWALTTNPLSAPYVARTTSELAVTLERAVRQEADAEWIAAALETAVAARHAERAEMLLALADDLDRDVDGTAAREMIEEETGALSLAVDCALCMADTGTCPSLQHVTFCAVPFEMSVLGDLNALRRATVAVTLGEEVDELDAGLALVSLGATGAVIFSGGTSVTVKAGATLLRMGRRLGTVTPELTRFIRIPIRWSRVGDVISGSARLEDLTDAAALARMSSVAADMGRVRAATSTAEALSLARHVDSPADARRLAQVAEAAGPRTTRTFEVLGKGRVFRATVRLSRATVGTLALAWLAVVQLAAILGSRLGAMALRRLIRAL
ncbi:hypothetical protein [Jannaschia marina]|uniref:hypothetical protein n=1 Tax=Jannaschia marina TaxID=2741674 RepID=UPI0015CBECBC|nr:hypothetical protein [Jannaschia marina]